MGKCKAKKISIDIKTINFPVCPHCYSTGIYVIEYVRNICGVGPIYNVNGKLGADFDWGDLQDSDTQEVGEICCPGCDSEWGTIDDYIDELRERFDKLPRKVRDELDFETV